MYEIAKKRYKKTRAIKTRVFLYSEVEISTFERYYYGFIFRGKLQP